MVRFLLFFFAVEKTLIFEVELVVGHRDAQARWGVGDEPHPQVRPGHADHIDDE